MFQLFTAGPGFTTEPGRHAISQLPSPGFLDDESKKIVDFIGDRGDELHRLGLWSDRSRWITRTINYAP